MPIRIAIAIPIRNKKIWSESGPGPEIGNGRGQSGKSMPIRIAIAIPNGNKKIWSESRLGPEIGNQKISIGRDGYFQSIGKIKPYIQELTGSSL